MRYIDADKLLNEINGRITRCRIKAKAGYPDTTSSEATLKSFRSFITSLQQEQSEDIVVIAKTFLAALSKTPYNNKPITDAQIIVRQLLLFFENTKEYNPDAILEKPEVELKKEIATYFHDWIDDVEENVNPNGIEISKGRYAHLSDIEQAARYFYKLGLNARKEDK